MTVTEDQHDGHPLGAQPPARPSGSAREAINEMLDAGLLDDVMDRIDGGGLALTGDGGFLPEMIKAVLERGLQSELSGHLGYEKGDPAGRGSPNSRNGSTPKTVATEVGDVALDVPRDRAGSVDALPGEAVDRAGATELTAGCLALRFAVRGDPGDLDRSVDLWRRSVAAGPRGPGPLWLSEPWRLIELGSVLLERARWAGGDDEFDEAISALRRAMGSTRDPLIRAIGGRRGCPVRA